MAIVEPGKGRAVIEHDGSELRITIPAPQQAFGILFVSLWLILWTVGEYFAAREFWTGQFFQKPEAFLPIWFAGWTLGGAFMIYTLLWQLAGKEIIEINSTSLKQTKQLLLLSRSREYAVANIANVRLAPPEPKYVRGKYYIQSQSFNAGAIAFDYGRDTCRLAQGLDEAEVEHVIGEMRKRVKSLSPERELEAS